MKKLKLESDIRNAINGIEQSFKSRFSRRILLSIFYEEVIRSMSGKKIRVAVVGGSPKEPEVLLAQSLGYEVEVVTFGIEKSDFLLDLNTYPIAAENSFDLVLVSQVLEHVWNIEGFFANIRSLMNTSSICWLSCPTSNRAHGFPNYFSAGYNEKFVAENSRKYGLVASRTGIVGSQRLYVMTHSLDTWPSEKAHTFPSLYGFDELSPLRRLAHRVFFAIPLLIIWIYTNPRVTNSERWATETWAVLVKKATEE